MQFVSIAKGEWVQMEKKCNGFTKEHGLTQWVLAMHKSVNEPGHNYVKQWCYVFGANAPTTLMSGWCYLHAK